MIRRIGDLLLANGGEISRDELELMPKVSDYLIDKENVSTVVIYGVYDTKAYVLIKCLDEGKREALRKKFCSVADVKEVGNYLLAKFQLGILNLTKNGRKLQILEDILLETIQVRDRRYMSRLNEIRRLVVA